MRFARDRDQRRRQENARARCRCHSGRYQRRPRRHGHRSGHYHPLCGRPRELIPPASSIAATTRTSRTPCIMKGKQIRRLPVLDEAMQMADDRHGEPRRRLARAAARHHRRGGESRLSPPSLRANPLTPRLAPVQASIVLARRARSCARDERRRLAPRRRSQACPTRPFAGRPVGRGYTRN
jgi:hypothetical protein